MPDYPGRFQLSRYVANDLSPEERRELESHLNTCQECRSTLNEIRNNAVAYEASAADHLPGLMARLAGVKQRRKPWARSAWYAGIGLAAAAATLLIVFLWPGGHGTEDLTFKGAFSFRVVAQRANEQFLVQDGDKLAPGDALRFVVVTDEPGYLTVFSVEAAGRLSPFYPRTDPGESPDPMMLGQPGKHELPGSVILDDWIGKEYLVVVFSREKFDRRRVHQEAKATILGKGVGAPEPASLGVTGSVGVLAIWKREGHTP